MPPRTLVATWDLSNLSQSEIAGVIWLHRDFESLGPNGDHRVKVSEHDFGPGGRYGGLIPSNLCCKRWMLQSFQPHENSLCPIPISQMSEVYFATW